MYVDDCEVWHANLDLKKCTLYSKSEDSVLILAADRASVAG